VAFVCSSAPAAQDKAARAGRRSAAEPRTALRRQHCQGAPGTPTGGHPQRAVTDVRLTLSSGQVVSLGRAQLNDDCGLAFSSSALPERDVFRGPTVARLAGWGNLRVSSKLPSTLVRGRTIVFDATLHDVSRLAFRLDPCPNYTITLKSFRSPPNSAPEVDRGQLNCEAAPASIPAGGFVTVAMRYEVPAAVPAGVAGFNWSLDQTVAAISASNPRTGDAVVE
jgi:hypothetical protein